MKMSCYFLVQDRRKYFPISTEENILVVGSCWILGGCDSEDKDDDEATYSKWLSPVIIVLLAVVLLIVFFLYHKPILRSNTCISQPR